MNIRGFVGGAGLVAAVLAASFWIVPSAFARVHAGIGISVPGVAVGVGNCWRCGYYPPPPPVYYQPAYYGYGYYQPYYRYHRWHGHWRDRDGYYHHRHHDDDDD